MALRFIHEKNSPQATLEFEGSLMDLVAEITYMANKIHAALHNSNPASAAAFRDALTVALSGEDSPVWEVSSMREGEQAVCIHVPKPPHDPSV
jgi:hypothetical protein